MAEPVISRDVEKLKEDVEDLKSSVSSGKQQLATAITGKGGTVADGDSDGVSTFLELKNGVNSIVVGSRKQSGSISVFLPQGGGSQTYGISTPFRPKVVLLTGVFGAGAGASWDGVQSYYNSNGITGTEVSSISSSGFTVRVFNSNSNYYNQGTSVNYIAYE